MERGVIIIPSVGRVSEVLSLQHCFLSCESCIYTVELVNMRHNIVFVNYSDLLDTKNVPFPFRVHARDGFFHLSIH